MYTEFRMILQRLSGRIVGWSIGILLYVILMAAFYESMAQMGNLQELLAIYPQEMLGFFQGIMELNTPQGYLDTYYYSYMSVILGILGIGVGAGLLAGDEERGTLDLVLAQPVSRTALFWGRVAGMAVALALIIFAGWLGWVLPVTGAEFGLSPWEMLLPSFPLYAQVMLFSSFALFLSMVLPASRSAGMLASALLVANYLVVGLSNINADLERFVRYTPLYYYQGGYAINGVDGSWLLVLFALAAVLLVAAWLLFVSRDIRVGGEHNWELGPARHRAARIAEGPSSAEG